MITKKIIFREAVPGDCKKIWQWRNENESREASFNSGHILYNQHIEWFKMKLKDENCKIFIILSNNNERIGQVRYDIDLRNKAAVVSINIDKKYRKQGAGSEALAVTAKHVMREAALDKVIAFIKKSNIISLAVFKKVGFKKSGITKFKGKEAVCLVLENNDITQKAPKGLLGNNRIYLRKLLPSDVSRDYVKWMGDKDVTKYTESRFRTYTKKELISYVRQINKDGRYIFLAIIKKNNNRHIGNIKIGPIDRFHRFADMGIIIGEKRYWGKGFATDAIKLAAEYAFQNLNLHKLTAGSYSCNIGSIKAFKNVGFKEEGNFKKHYLCDGRYVDRVCLGIINPHMGISRSEFKESGTEK